MIKNDYVDIYYCKIFNIVKVENFFRDFNYIFLINLFFFYKKIYFIFF